MKKLFTSLSMAALVSVTAGAQQLANPGFENDWGSMACWAAGSFSNNGDAPAPWKTSNVGSPSLAKSVVSEKASGYQSASAVKVFNKSVMGKVVPGYVTLGQPWSTAKGVSGSNSDGGTFGGVDFTYRPDAVSFMYLSTGSGQPTFVAYAWKGTYSQESVPANIAITGNCKTVTMIDRDRNILGISTSQGGTVSNTDGELIASVTERLVAETSDWTAAEIALDYKSVSTPEKFNLIFAADDYFSASPSANNELTVDNVKLLYYSRLASLSVNGAPVAGFDSKTFSYDLSDTEMPAESAIAYELLGKNGGSSATVKVDNDNSRIEITVSRDDAACADYDDASSHTYVLQFKQEAGSEPVEVSSVDYSGIVSILANEDLGFAENIDRAGKVTITSYDNGTCTFLLPDFALGDSEEEYIGDIKVVNVKTTTVGDHTSYNGTTKGLTLSLSGYPIVANVIIEGTTTASGDASMKIHVIWLPDPENDPEGEYGIPIEVEFNGKNTTAIKGVEIDNSAAAVEYFNIQGVRVNPENLTPGLYIRRQGTDVKKIYLK